MNVDLHTTFCPRTEGGANAVEEAISDRRRHEASDSAPIGPFHMDAIEFDAKPAFNRVIECVACRGTIGSRRLLAHLDQAMLTGNNRKALTEFYVRG